MKLREPRIGLAIGPDRLVAVELRRAGLGIRRGRVVERPLAQPDEGGAWPALADALREVAAELEGRGGRVSVALLRPLAQTKVLGLPPVRRRELRRLVTRAARRHFLIGREPVIADAARTAPRRRGAPVPTLAVCAPQRVLEEVAGAVAQAGWRLELMTSAALAVTEAVSVTMPASRRGPLALLVCSPGWMEGIAAQGVTIRLIEPWGRRAASDLGALARQLAQAAADGDDAVTAVRTVALVAPEDAERAAVIREAGGVVEEVDPAVLAAYGAALVPERAPLLLPEPLRRALALRVARRVAALAAAAACLLGVAAGLRLWGLEREFQAVARERRDRAAEVARLLELRRDAEGVRARLDALARLEASAQRWTPVLAGLAQALPDSAYLLTFAARGPRAQLTGIAQSSSAVVAALEGSPLWHGASLTGAQRRQDGSSGEFFEVTLSFGSDTVARPAEPGGRTGR